MFINGFIQEKSHSNAINVIKDFRALVAFNITSGLTLEKSRSNAINVINGFLRIVIFETTSEFTLERNHSSVTFVIKGSDKVLIYQDTSEFIPAKDSNAIFVRKDSCRVVSSIVINGLILEKNHSNAVYAIEVLLRQGFNLLQFFVNHISDKYYIC